MDGSSLSLMGLIAISVVTTVSLAAWIFAVYHAASHPSWRQPGAASGADHRPDAGGIRSTNRR